jgi:hypothetical protein
MNLTELVKSRGFDIDGIIIVRHKKNKEPDEPFIDLNFLYELGMIEFYQSIQSQSFFNKCKYLLSFIGGEGTTAKFIGAYEVGAGIKFDINSTPKEFPYQDMFNKKIDSYYQYQLKKINLLEDRINLLVVDWGKSAKSWKQGLWDGDKAKSIVSYGDGREYENAEEIEYSEGREYYRLHKMRERNPFVIERAKSSFMKKHGRLFCEVCGTDFSIVYGERGKDLIEGHHRKLVSKMKEGDKTKVEDIAMLCSNCHRMIHRKPILSVEQLAQELYAKRELSI